MAYENGRIPYSALIAIEDGLFLEQKAALAWMAARPVIAKETKVTPVVTSPDGAYRTFARQQYWRKWWADRGSPGNAATPGYSSHGLGVSIDIYNISKFELAHLERIMARFGFRRNIPHESWHFSHDGRTIPAAVVAASEVIKIQEEEEDMPLNDADIAKVADAVWQYKVKRTAGPVSAIQELADTKTAVASLPAAVWNVTVGRNGVRVPVIQELADAKTQTLALTALVEKLAGLAGIGDVELGELVRAAVADAVIDLPTAAEIATATRNAIVAQ